MSLFPLKVNDEDTPPWLCLTGFSRPIYDYKIFKPIPSFTFFHFHTFFFFNLFLFSFTTTRRVLPVMSFVADSFFFILFSLSVLNLQVSGHFVFCSFRFVCHCLFISIILAVILAVILAGILVSFPSITKKKRKENTHTHTHTHTHTYIHK